MMIQSKTYAPEQKYINFTNNGNLFTILFEPIYGETGTAKFEISSPDFDSQLIIGDNNVDLKTQ